MNEMFDPSQERNFMPVFVERPGVLNSRETMLVPMGSVIGHWRETGWRFPKVGWTLSSAGSVTCERDDTRGIPWR